MLLYNSPVSGNCYKARLLFAQLGIEYERGGADVVDRSNRPRRWASSTLPFASQRSCLTMAVAGGIERNPLVLRRRHAVPSG